MTEPDWARWAVVLFFFGLMCAFAFLLGSVAFQVVLRLSRRIDRSLYRKWGVEEDTYWPVPGAWFIGWVVLVIVSTPFTFLFALSSTLLMTDVSRLGGDQVYETFTFFFVGVILGVSIEWQRFENTRRKVERLDGLRQVFHDRFSLSELLSVYESLQHSPPLFWEEYTQLPDDDVDEETNRKFRERSIPYHYSQSSRHNRKIVVVTVLALIVGVIVAFRAFFA